MDLLVADRAVLVTGRSQIVKRRRDRAGQNAAVLHRGGADGGQIRVALQTVEAHLMPVQHAGIGAAVRFVAGIAALELHGRVLERERTAFIAMTFEAARLIRREGLGHGRPQGAVGIVAIHAGHLVLRNLVAEGFGELRLDALMATGAERVHLRSGARHQARRAIRMDGVAGDAAHGVFHVAALDPLGMFGRIEMAAQADLVGLFRHQLLRIADLGRVRRPGMFRASAMAGLATMFFPAAPLIGLDKGVGALLVVVPDIFVTGLAGLGAHVLFAELLRRVGGRL